MSSRSEVYENFFNSWGEIYQLIDGVEPSLDEQESNTVREVARLLKVIKYLDVFIKNIDSDLIPLNILTELINIFNSYKQTIELALNEQLENQLVTANQYADQILLKTSPFSQKSSSHIQASKSAFDTYIKFIDSRLESYNDKYKELMHSLETKNDEVVQLYKNINEASEEISVLKTKLLTGTEDSESIESNINSFENKVEEQASRINTYFNSLFTDEDSIKSTIDSFQENIRESDITVKKIKNDLATEMEELQAFYDEVFGQKDDSGEVKNGLKYEIQERKNALDLMKVNQQNQYDALKTQIEGIIPGATSVGLASAYYDLSTSFIVPIRIYTGLFVISIIMLLMLAFYFTDQNLILVSSSDATRDIAVIKDVGIFLLQRLPIILPIIWLAIFASKRRSEAERLKQEYAHKEALAKSYQSFKQQIEDLDSENKEPLLEKLLAATIDTIATNASSTLDKKHGDNAPLTGVVEKTINKLPSISRKE